VAWLGGHLGERPARIGGNLAESQTMLVNDLCHGWSQGRVMGKPPLWLPNREGVRENYGVGFPQAVRRAMGT
jgi:hypothetical protein